MSTPNKSKRGGARPGSGRKSQGKERVTLTLSTSVLAKARPLTDNLSGTVDALLTLWVQHKTLAREDVQR